MQGICRVIFLANLPAIAAGLEQGWSMTRVYEQHREVLMPMGYRQFSRYVARLNPTRTALLWRKETAQQTRSSHGQVASGLQRGTSSCGFVYAATVPEKDDLI
jgi:hypothetical protein